MAVKVIDIQPELEITIDVEDHKIWHGDQFALLRLPVAHAIVY